MKRKRKYRAEVEAKRVARGYRPKKKTSLKDYEYLKRKVSKLRASAGD
jgi:hypothetical protein